MASRTRVAGVEGAWRSDVRAADLAVRPQLAATGLKLPLPEGTITTPKLTVPVGVVASAATGTVSRTVAVQVLVPPVGTVAGLGTEEGRVGEEGRARGAPDP